MKALIFNSGLGNRMGEFTLQNHKSMARLSNGETILARQLRLLAAAGFTEVIITTGPFAEQLRAETEAPHLCGLHFTFVENPIYDETNYIYSMYLAREHLNDDMVMLHGDLVFNAAALSALLTDERPDLGMVNEHVLRPEKDFKARVSKGVITEVSVSISDVDCHAFQPLYKLSKRAMKVWLDRVVAFCELGDTQVYAENALNEIASEANIQAFSYADYSVNEVDTLEDLALVSAEIRLFDFAEQPVFSEPDAFTRIPELLAAAGAQAPLLVGGQGYDSSFVKAFLDGSGLGYVRFSGYSANPKLEEVHAGLALFQEQKCDAIISLGGGSAVDVAKCIQLLAASGGKEFPAFGAPLNRRIPHLCVPTTAGTGSESTHFAVVYIDGEKYSIAHDAAIPDWVILEPKLLETLPDYHKKASLLDALAQCVESSWAASATEQSIGYAMKGIELILAYVADYVTGGFDEALTRQMQCAANLSGKAINLTKTTAPHAMSYKLTSLYGTAHGHSAALCLVGVWQHFVELAERGNLEGLAVAPALDRLAKAFGVDTRLDAVVKLRMLIDSFHLPTPVLREAAELDVLVASVNYERLSNSPVALDAAIVRRIYQGLFDLPATGRELSITEVQAEATRLLARFDQFCQQQGLQYFVAFGTLLGAVRHSGSIPWDDDVDVVMPRPDFDRFIEMYPIEGDDDTVVFAPGRPDYPLHYGKLVSTRTWMTEHLARFPGDYGVFLDIFPLDGVPRRWPRVHKSIAGGLQRMLIFSYFLRPRLAQRETVKQRVRRIVGMIGRVIRESTYRRWLERSLRRVPFEQAQQLSSLLSTVSLEKSSFLKAELEGFRMLPYGDLRVRGFTRSEEVLERIYGPTWRTPIKRDQAQHGRATWR